MRQPRAADEPPFSNVLFRQRPCVVVRIGFRPGFAHYEWPGTIAEEIEYGH